MASKSWMTALSEINKNQFYIPSYTTSKVYSRIKSMGLETVIWEEFNIDEGSVNQIKRFLKQFIKRNKPCLFIYDPKNFQLKKGFLFGIKTLDEVELWIIRNKENLEGYKYLITTQITNPGNGFVGTVLSDGNGKLICETLHYPGISNHRELSQQGRDSKYIDVFTADEFELSSVRRGFIPNNLIRRIINMYGEIRGYFEFVRGMQGGVVDFYTTGFEDSRFFSIPNDRDEVYVNENTNLDFRLRALNAKL